MLSLMHIDNPESVKYKEKFMFLFSRTKIEDFSDLFGLFIGKFLYLKLDTSFVF